VTTDKLVGMTATVKNLPYFGFGNLATVRRGPSPDDQQMEELDCPMC